MIFYKINAFERELEFLKKAKPNVPAKQLEKEAAEIVQNTFPNYDKVSPGIKALDICLLVALFRSLLKYSELPIIL